MYKATLSIAADAGVTKKSIIKPTEIIENHFQSRLSSSGIENLL